MAPTKAVVITGASTGIGAACALHLDQRGWRVFAGVRRQADAESLRAKASSRLTPIALDLADTVSISTAARAMRLPKAAPSAPPKAGEGAWG